MLSVSILKLIIDKYMLISLKAMIENEEAYILIGILLFGIGGDLTYLKNLSVIIASQFFELWDHKLFFWNYTH